MNAKIIIVLIIIIAVFIVIALLRNIIKSNSGTKRYNKSIRDNQQRQRDSNKRIDSGLDELKQNNNTATERAGNIKTNTDNAGKLIDRARAILEKAKSNNGMGED